MPLCCRTNAPWGARRHAGVLLRRALLTAARRGPTSQVKATVFEKFSRIAPRGQIRSRNQTHLPDDG